MVIAHTAAERVAFGFPRSYRLLKADEFSSVFGFRHSHSNQYFQVWSRPNGLSQARIGVVVAKRIVRHAVFRNRIKRLTRELFRHQVARLSQVDLIVRAKRPLYRRDMAAANVALQQLFSRYILCPTS